MSKRPKITFKPITQAQAKGYEYVRPNPGVRAIAAINGRGAYRMARGNSARSSMQNLSASQKRARAAQVVSTTTRRSRSNKGSETMPRRRLRRNRKSAWAGTRRVTVRIPRSNAHQSRYSYSSRTGSGYTRPVSFRVPAGEKLPITLLAKNRRRRKTSKKRRTAKRKLSMNARRRLRRMARTSMRKNTSKRRRVVSRKRRTVSRRKMRRNVGRRRVVRRRKRRTSLRRNRRTSLRRNRRVSVRARRKVSRRPRRAMRKNRRSAKRRSTSRRKMRRNGTKRRAPARRRIRARARKGFLRKNSGAMAWVKVGAFITTGVIAHKFLSGFFKNLLVAKQATVAADASVDAQVDGAAAASGLGFLPTSLVPYAGTISGALTAALGVYLTTRVVKNAEARQMIAGGMVASFLHTVIVDVLKKQAPTFAQQVSGLGAADSNAARLSAMYGFGASIEPQYAQINGMGEYFGTSGLGALPSYEAAAGMGEYFSGVGEYFTGTNGLGEYGSNPDIMQAAAGYGAVDAGGNTNHIDPSSNLDRELSIAEAAAGVGSVMQAAAGLGNIRAGQTWIPGESDPRLWAGVRPVDRSQMATAMIPAGTLQSGGGQGIFG